MHVTRQNWWSAALEGRVAVSGIEKALEGKIPNPDARFGTGLYLYYADRIPRRYPILKPLFLFYPDGDKERGLNDLLETTRNGVFAKVVASYMYSIILYTREHKHREAYKIMRSLVDRYPQNPTFLVWLASMASRIGKYDEAEQLLNLYTKRANANRPFYPKSKMVMVYFRYGALLYKKSMFQQALYYLDKAIVEDVPESSYLERFKVYSMLQRGYCYEKLSRLEDARNSFETVLDMPEYRGSHDQAKEHLERVIKMQIKQGLRKSTKGK
jgi:tetratricopeptide (TPR) repeat protein